MSMMAPKAGSAGATAMAMDDPDKEKPQTFYSLSKLAEYCGVKDVEDFKTWLKGPLFQPTFQELYDEAIALQQRKASWASKGRPLTMDAKTIESVMQHGEAYGSRIFSARLPDNTEMAENLGVAIDLSGGEVHTTTLSPTSPPSSENVFMESYDVACHLRELMAESANIDGTRKFREWPYVHHLSTHSNSTGCSSLTISGLEIAFISGNHVSAFQPSSAKEGTDRNPGELGEKADRV